ncbi:MAG: phosphohistidine phosphatase SixA [Anaerolineae bacterium]
MNLYLVQHAEAKSEAEDPERPLTDKRWQDVRKVADFLARQAGLRVHQILHSGKTRAHQTAEVLAEQLKPSEGVQAVEGLEPLADPSIWANRLAALEHDVLIVGHLPHLSKLTALLVCEDENQEVVKFQIAGVVCLGQGAAGGWVVRWMVIPEILGEGDER